MAWDKEAAQAATDAAAKELKEMMDGMTDEQIGAIVQLTDWWRRWYNGASGQHATGHKALGRIMINT